MTQTFSILKGSSSSQHRRVRRAAIAPKKVESGDEPTSDDRLRLRARLGEILCEAESLSWQEQTTFALEMGRAASRLAHASGDTNLKGPLHQCERQAYALNTPFFEWLEGERRTGHLYGSIADAAAGYEAAGYKWLK